MQQRNGWAGRGSGRGRLLVVVENRDLLEALQEMLETMGFEVAAFPAEVPAIAATVGKSALFDLLIADAIPAIGDGAGMVDRFRARLGTMPALLLSGAGMSDQLRRRAAAGDVAVLPAPFTARQLEEAVGGAMSTPLEAVTPIELEPATTPETPRGGSTGPRRSSLRWALPLAAGLVLAVGLVVRQPASGPPPLPSSPGGGQTRGAAVEALEPRGELAASPGRFVWTEVPQAASYVLTVSRVDDALVWRDETRRAFGEPPEDIVAALLPAVRYRWTVEALDAAGNPFTRSTRMEFMIRPNAQQGSVKEEETP